MSKYIWRGWVTFLSVFLVTAMCQSAQAKVKIKIRRPRKHTILSDYKFRVKGSIKRAPDGMFFWVCIQEKGNKQWKPQAAIKVDGNYFETIAYIVVEGIDDRDKATKINVGVVGVDSAGNDVMKTYVEKAFKTDSYPYTDLPAGAKVLKVRKIKYISE